MRHTKLAIALATALALGAGAALAQEEAATEAAQPSSQSAQPSSQSAQPSKPPAPASSQAKSLAELLDMVKQGLEVEKKENQRRVNQFIQKRAEQQSLLEEARGTLAREEAVSQKLETNYNENEVVLAEDAARLTERLGQLGELFGV
ncbi:MAG: hypothetical protein ACR2P8_05565, partial [Myxococcota bacterium]